MTTYSLLVVHNKNIDGTVDGSWLQDSVGDLAKARKKAIDTMKVNSRKIQIAVVKDVGFCGPCEMFFNKNNLF